MRRKEATDLLYWRDVERVKKLRGYVDDLESDGLVEIVGRQILYYLLQFPEAKDSVTGIKQWWLSNCSDDFTIEEIEKTLQWFVSREWLISRTTNSIHMVYGLNESKLEEIKEFIRKNKSSRRTSD